MIYRNEKSDALLKELNKVQANYDQLGLEDPFSATVGNPNKDLDVYFEHGRQQIAGILSAGQELGINPTNGKALDFGCGIGRVTRTLAKQFDEVHGLDISPSMIALANDYNTNPVKCHFHLHSDYQLKLFADDFFDLIVGINVFRYISPALSQAYVREFIRVVKPGGLVYFETSEAVSWRRIFPAVLLQIYRKFRHWQNSEPGRQDSRQDRFHFSEEKMRAIISEAGGQVLRVEAAPSPTLWRHLSFFVTKCDIPAK
jgi:ubiquinone/menaquinone biosynthesis C-methylase UbiE